MRAKQKLKSELLLACKNENINMIKEIIKKREIKKLKTDKYILINILNFTNNLSVLKLLLENNFKIFGETILNCVIFRSLDVLKLVLKYNKYDKNLNYKDNYGFTSVMYASMNENSEILKLLIKKGGSVSILNNNKDTSLNFACMKNKILNVKIILDNLEPELLNSKNKNNKTCLSFVNNLNIFKMILEYNFKQKKNYRLNLDNKDKYGNTIFLKAIQNNNLCLVNELLINKININKIKLQKSKSYFYNACKKKNLDLIKLLIKNRVNITKNDYELLRKDKNRFTYIIERFYAYLSLYNYKKINIPNDIIYKIIKYI